MKLIYSSMWSTSSTWAMWLRGIIAIIIGLFTLFFPNITLSILVILVGLYILMNGVLAIVFSFYGRQYEDKSWLLYLLEGIVGSIVGLAVLLLPKMTSILLLYFIAAWAIVTGIVQIAAYIKLQRIFERELLLLIGGILSIVIGIVFFRFPLQGIVAITWIVGLYALIFGILTITSVCRTNKHF